MHYAAPPLGAIIHLESLGFIRFARLSPAFHARLPRVGFFLWGLTRVPVRNYSSGSCASCLRYRKIRLFGNGLSMWQVGGWRRKNLPWNHTMNCQIGETKKKRRLMAHGNGRHAGHAKNLCYVMLGFSVKVLGPKNCVCVPLGPVPRRAVTLQGNHGKSRTRVTTP